MWTPCRHCAGATSQDASEASPPASVQDPKMPTCCNAYDVPAYQALHWIPILQTWVQGSGVLTCCNADEVLALQALHRLSRAVHV